MDYKEEIIEIVEKMHNITFIAMIHAFAKRLYQKEKGQESTYRYGGLEQCSNIRS